MSPSMKARRVASLGSAVALCVCQVVLGLADTVLAGMVAPAAFEYADLPLATRRVLPWLGYGLWIGILLASGHAALGWRSFSDPDEPSTILVHVGLLAVGVSVLASGIVAVALVLSPLAS